MPGLAERAVWLVDDAVLPPLDHFSAAERHDFALPPILTSLHSFELEVPRLGGGTLDLVGFKGVDADATAAKALSLYDEVLAPLPLQGARRNGGATRGCPARASIAAKGRIAVKLARRLHTILADDLGARTNGVAPVALLQDRRRWQGLSQCHARPRRPVGGSRAETRPRTHLEVARRGIRRHRRADGESGLSYVLDLRNGGGLRWSARAPPRLRHRRRAGLCNIGNAVPAPPTLSANEMMQRRDRPDIDDSGPGAPGRYRPTAWLKLVESRLYPLPTAAIPDRPQALSCVAGDPAEGWTPEAEPVSVAATSASGPARATGPMKLRQPTV